MVKAVPAAVGNGAAGFGVQVVGFPPVQLRVTSALNPFTAVSVPLNVADWLGKLVSTGLLMPKK